MWDTINADPETVTRLHESYLESLEPARERLRGRIAGVAGVQLDGSIESLVPLNAWFMDEILETPDKPGLSLPSWWDPAMPTAETGDPETYPFTRSQLELIDEVQAYYAEVLQKVRPDAPWVIYKRGKRNINNGRSMIKLAKDHFLAPRTVVYGVALGSVLYNQPSPVDVLATVARDIQLEGR